MTTDTTGKPLSAAARLAALTPPAVPDGEALGLRLYAEQVELPPTDRRVVLGWQGVAEHARASYHRVAIALYAIGYAAGAASRDGEVALLDAMARNEARKGMKAEAEIACLTSGDIDETALGQMLFDRARAALEAERARCEGIAKSQAPDVPDDTSDDYRRGQKRSALSIADLISNPPRRASLAGASPVTTDRIVTKEDQNIAGTMSAAHTCACCSFSIPLSPTLEASYVHGEEIEIECPSCDAPSQIVARVVVRFKLVRVMDAGASAV